MATQQQVTGIETLEPGAVWNLFAQVAEIPRPSRKEERIRNRVREIAEAHGLTTRSDTVGNLVIDVPASSGCESAPLTVLQAHFDMVCEKNASCTHNFDEDPISLIVDTDAATGEPIVRADETTLGADNGIGLCMALAAAITPEVVHGPLELLFTMDEESGMTGAKALTPDSFKGRRLLNLDSEEDDILYIGCAGGSDCVLSWSLPTAAPPKDGERCRIEVTGLRGGHSGCDIHENRGNAIKLLVRTLLYAHPENLHLAAIDGGQIRNAIPREASATVLGPAGTLDMLRQSAANVQKEASRESHEGNVSIRASAAEADSSNVLSIEDSWRILSALSALPHGVIGMHPKVPALVETSNNVASIKLDVGDSPQTVRVQIANLARSSSESRKKAALGQIAAVGRLAGADVEISGDYPGWEPNPDSQLLVTCRRVYADLFGEEPKVAAIHAGLECGLIGERVGDMDMISFGPNITGAHSPDEQVQVNSVAKSWKYLVAVLDKLSRGE